MRSTIRNLLLKAGWDLRRLKNTQREYRERIEQEEFKTWRALEKYKPEIVLDVGANEGQFAELARKLFPEASIISFEPLQQCINILKSKSEALQPFKYFPYALGSENITSQIHRNDFSPSSSLLSIGRLHTQELPFTEKTSKEEIEIRRLDSLLKPQDLQKKNIWKIDVQGYTLPVLEGSLTLLPYVSAIVCEISLYPLYDGEAGFDQIYSLLKKHGFVYRGNVSQWQSKQDFSFLQCDCVFENLECVIK